MEYHEIKIGEWDESTTKQAKSIMSFCLIDTHKHAFTLYVSKA